jgi:hypothetical protein
MATVGVASKAVAAMGANRNSRLLSIQSILEPIVRPQASYPTAAIA